MLGSMQFLLSDVAVTREPNAVAYGMMAFGVDSRPWPGDGLKETNN